MAQLDSLDLLVLVFILLATTAYFTKGRLWAIPRDPYAEASAAGGSRKAAQSRDIVEKMERSSKNCIVFYGSQTGTAEDYASRLAKEGKARFGLETMIADLEEYDFDNLDAFPPDKVAIFVLATYGEGEPTDNAVDFFDFITTDDPSFSQGNDPPLSNLNYVAFGLGNTTYEQYNAMVRIVDKALQKLGAHRIGDAGEGDDGSGTMEEDFLAWKDPMWAALADRMGLQERESVYEPIFELVHRQHLTVDSPDVYLGEPNRAHLEGNAKPPFGLHNPYIAPVAESQELFSSNERNCLHMEIDISDSNLTYQTGDHIAVWPMNPDQEVDRFLQVMGLLEKRHEVISAKSLEPTTKVPFPTPTTYDAVLRHHLEICAPVSRQFVSILAAFSPTDEIKAEMVKMGSDKDYFHQKTASHFYNIARFLQQISNGQTWTNIPFSAFMEGLTKLQPRFYSISSSSLLQPQKVAITAVVEMKPVPGQDAPFRGVATNYLLDLKQRQNGEALAEPPIPSYAIAGPRQKYNHFQLPVHMRHSNFKLPSDPGKPMILIGPGTGVAPFRAFVQERARQAEMGISVGRILLFFGCRNRKEDFVYESEWEANKKTLGDRFELITAFSREGPEKVYVQHRLRERAEEVNELLLQKGYFYVCGDAAAMARQVNAELIQIIAQKRGLSDDKAEMIVKQMRSKNLYQEDVWS